MSNTIVVNLFGGPGSTKSTTSAGVFHLMKLAGMNVEVIDEYAKHLVWTDRKKCLKCQPYVFGKQYYKLYSLLGKVDFIINDSPILLSVTYNEDYPESFNRSVIDIFKSMNNLNFYLKRGDIQYNPIGRNQTFSEAKEIDEKIVRLLIDNGINVTTILSDPNSSEKIFKLACEMGHF